MQSGAFASLFDVNKSDEWLSNSQDLSNLDATICRDYLRHVCKRGRKCKFKHPSQEECDRLRADRGEVVFCHDYQNGACRRPACKFLHVTKEEEEAYRLSGSLPSNLCSSYSTEKSSDLKVPLCKDYLNHNCHRGATCKFRHLKAQPSDQPPPAPVPPPPPHVPVTSQNFAYVDFPLTTQSSPVNGHVYLPQTVNYTVRTSQPCSAACAVTSTLPTTVSTSTFLLPSQQSYSYAQLPVSAVPSDIITSSVSSDILLPISQTVIVAPSMIEHVGSQGEFTQPQHHHHHHQQHQSILSAPHTAFSVLQKQQQQQQPSSQQPQAHPPNGLHLTSQATQLGTVQTITLASDPHKAFTQHLYAQIPAVANPTSCSAVAAHHLTVRSAVAPHSLSTSTATAIVGTPVIPASSVYLQQQQPQQQHQSPECLLAPSSAAATALAAHSSPALVNSHPASHEMPHPSQLVSLVESGTTLLQTDRQQQQPLSSSSALHFAPHSAVAALPVSAQPPPPSAVRPVAGNSVSLILHPTSEVTPLPTRIVSLPTMAASPAVSGTATFTTASVDNTGLSTIPLSVLAPVMPACSTTTFQPAAVLHAASDAPTGHTFLAPGSGTFHTFVSNAACQMTVNHSGAGQHMTLSIPVSSEAYVPTATVTNTPTSHSSSPTVELPPTTTSPTVVCHSTTLDQQKQQEANTAAAFAAAACFGAAAAAATRVAAVANSSVASSGFINSASSLTAGLSHHSASTSAAVAAAAAAAVAAVVSAPSSSSVSTRLSLPPPPLSVSRSLGLADCDTPATAMTVKNEAAAPSPSFSATSTETTEQKLGPDTMGNPGSPSRSCSQRPCRSFKVSSRSRHHRVAADAPRLQISHSADLGDANAPLAAATTKATPGLLDAATVGGLMLHQAGDQGSAATPPPPPSSSTSQQCAALMSFNSATYTMTTAAAAAAAVVAAAAVEHQQQQQQEQKRVAAALANVAGTSATCSQLDHVTLLSDHGLRLDQTSPASQSTASSSLPSPTTTFCLKEPPPSKVSSHSHSSLQRCFKQRHKRPTAHQLGVSETALVYGGTDVMNSMSAFAQRLMVSTNRRSRKTFHDQRGLRRYMGRDISVNETEEDEDDEEEEEDFEDMVDFDDDEVVGEDTQLSPRFGRSSGLSAEDAASLTREDLYEQYASSRTGRHLGDEQEGSVISRDPRDPTVYLFQSKRSRPSVVESATPDYRSSHSFNRDDQAFDSPPPFTKQVLESNSSARERRKSRDLVDQQNCNNRGRPRSLDRCFGCRPVLGLGSRRRCFSFSACDSSRRSRLPEKSNYRQELPECQPKGFSKVDLSELSPLNQTPGPCGQPNVFPTVSHSDIPQTPASALVVETHKTSLRPCNGRVNLSNIPTREPKRFGFKRPSKSVSNTRLHKRKRLGRLDLDDAYDFCTGPEFFVNLPTFGSPTPSAVPSSCSKEFCDERFAAAAAAAASATSAFDAFMVKGISTRGPGGDDEDEDDEEDEASLIRMSRTPSQAPPPSPSSVYLKKRLLSVKRENANLRCQLQSLLEQRNSLRKANSFLLKQNARLRNCNKRAVAAVRAAEQAVGVSRGGGHRTNRTVVLSKRPSSREPSTDQ